MQADLDAAVFMQPMTVFIQDSALSHRAKATQDFLRNVVAEFINAEEWTPWLTNTIQYNIRTLYIIQLRTSCKYAG